MVRARFGFWNVRGLNEGVKCEMASSICRSQHLRLLALLETKVDVAKEHLIVNKLPHGWRYVTNSSFVNPGRIWIS
jgi:hypothetical protein